LNVSCGPFAVKFAVGYLVAARITRQKQGINNCTLTFPSSRASLVEQHNASAITKAGNWITSKINCLTESANMSLLFHIRIFATSYPSQTSSITQTPAPSISTSTAIDFSKRIDWR
jgi:hypothetical protein